MLLAHFGVNILANIHPNKYDEVIEYIDNMELVSWHNYIDRRKREY